MTTRGRRGGNIAVAVRGKKYCFSMRGIFLSEEILLFQQRNISQKKSSCFSRGIFLSEERILLFQQRKIYLWRNIAVSTGAYFSQNKYFFASKVVFLPGKKGCCSFSVIILSMRAFGQKNPLRGNNWFCWRVIFSSEIIMLMKQSTNILFSKSNISFLSILFLNLVDQLMRTY